MDVPVDGRTAGVDLDGLPVHWNDLVELARQRVVETHAARILSLSAASPVCPRRVAARSAVDQRYPRGSARLRARSARVGARREGAEASAWASRCPPPSAPGAPSRP